MVEYCQTCGTALSKSGKMFVCYACNDVMKEQHGKAFSTVLSVDVVEIIQEHFPQLKNLKLTKLELDGKQLKIHGNVPEKYDLKSFVDSMKEEFI